MTAPHPNWCARTKTERQALHDRALAEAARQFGTPRDDPCANLTDRQRAILRLVAADKSFREVGALLGVTEQTVKGHMTVAYRKLGIRGGRPYAHHAARAAYLLGRHDAAVEHDALYEATSDHAA